MLTLEQTKSLFIGYGDLLRAADHCGWALAEDRFAELFRYALGGPIPEDPRACVIELLEVLGSEYEAICEDSEVFSEAVLEIILSLSHDMAGKFLPTQNASKLRKRA
jgi:hypothetical protein